MGAGLPVMGTLKHLLETGDKIIKIEGILSGTLSYIFNTFGDGRPFSEVVADAKAKGYTEPDPRDDLNGTDVARKVRTAVVRWWAGVRPEYGSTGIVACSAMTVVGPSSPWWGGARPECGSVGAHSEYRQAPQGPPLAPQRRFTLCVHLCLPLTLLMCPLN